MSYKIGNRSDMIIMSMCNYEPDNIFFFAFEIDDVGNNVVYPGHVFFWHSEAHVDQEDFVLILQNHHIASNLT